MFVFLWCVEAEVVVDVLHDHVQSDQRLVQPAPDALWRPQSQTVDENELQIANKLY